MRRLTSRGRRLAGSSVSSRRVSHRASTTADTTEKPNTQRHVPLSSSASPIPGPRIGAIRNTAMMSDITRAMRSPT